jgi:hypothetical protein
MRKNWLTAVMVIAYKYPYGHDEALVGEKIVGLLRIIIHTLAAQSHVCDRFSKPVTGLTMRSRDLSSIGGETDQNLPDDNMFEQEGNFSKLLFFFKMIHNCSEFLIFFFFLKAKTPSILTLKKAMKIMRIRRRILKQKRMKLSKR